MVDKSNEYGFVPSSPTQARGSNTGIFEVNDIVDLLAAGQWSLQESFKLIQSQTFSAQSEVEFTSIDETVYDVHIIVISNVISSVSSNVYWLQVSTDGGSTYENTNYAYANLIMSGNSSSSTYAINKSTNTTVAPLSATTNATGTAHHFSSVIYNYDFGNPNKYSMGTIQSVYEDPTGEQESVRGKYSRNAAETVNAFKIFQNTGTMSGVITLYGLVK